MDLLGQPTIGDRRRQVGEALPLNHEPQASCLNNEVADVQRLKPDGIGWEERLQHSTNLALGGMSVDAHDQ
jgi:hypothetical protein